MFLFSIIQLTLSNKNGQYEYSSGSFRYGWRIG